MPPAPDKIAYRVPEAALASGLGQSTLWEQMKAGHLRSIKACGRRLILKGDLEAFLNSMPAA